MPDILPLLLRLQPVLPKTTCRQLAHILVAILAMTGRITQKGISRWTDKGARYRTIQRFFHTNIDWLAVNWAFFQQFVYDKHGVYLFAGEETVISKAGKKTFGLDRFFSSLADKAIPAVACFSIALIPVGKRHASSLSNEQVVRTQEEKAQAKARQQQRKERTASTTAQRAHKEERAEQAQGTSQGEQEPEQSRQDPLPGTSAHPGPDPQSVPTRKEAALRVLHGLGRPLRQSSGLPDGAAGGSASDLQDAL